MVKRRRGGIDRSGEKREERVDKILTLSSLILVGSLEWTKKLFR
jgi:hypothetical protein